MRIAWAVVCLIATIVVAHVLMHAASPPQPGASVSLSLLLEVNLPAALAILAVSLLFAAAAGRLDAAARVATILGVLGLLLALSHSFWPLATSPDKVMPARPVYEWFFAPLWGVALGGLFFESLSRRSSRARGCPAEPAVGDAWLFLCVPLAGLVILLTVVRF